MITQSDLLEAQKSWAEDFCQLAASRSNRQLYEPLALRFLTDNYTFDDGDCLFKPSRVRQQPFRYSMKAALSYYIGGDSDYPEDIGFALGPWVEVRFQNSGFLFFEKRAAAMGVYEFVDDRTRVLRFEYALGYLKEETGRLRINFHHSSVPFAE